MDGILHDAHKTEITPCMWHKSFWLLGETAFIDKICHISTSYMNS